MSLSADLKRRLTLLSEQPDDEFDLLEAAFVVSKLLKPSASIEQYRSIVDTLCQQLHQAYRLQLTFHPPLIARINVLQNIMVNEQGFHGDEDAFDDPDQMNLFTVLDEKCATALTLSLILHPLHTNPRLVR